MSAPGSVAIVHYHLSPGGVTTVIRHACTALAERGVRVALIVGKPPEQQDEWDAEVRVVDGLVYDETANPTDPHELADRLLTAAADALGGPPPLWHVHNHTLGKNRALPIALRLLAQRGQRLLFQLHDFAEDGRPENYERLAGYFDRVDDWSLAEALYPAASHVHYATINGRDLRYLRQAGAAEAHTHLIPNMADLHGAPEPVEPLASREGRLFLYPTRAIRRKNLGELLLWATLSQTGDEFAVTRAPNNPLQLPIYERWRSLARSLALPVRFEVGAAAEGSYIDLLHSADVLVTTSVAEGFGLVFLEPWLVHRPLAGRHLPQITRDIIDESIDLRGLYDRLDVPLDWVGETDLRSRLRDAMHRSYALYRRMCTDDDVAAAYADMTHAGVIDFGRLDEPLQQRVIEGVHEHPARRSEVRPPELFDSAHADPRRVKANHDATRRLFGVHGYGDRLLGVYEKLLASPVSDVEALDADRLLDQFLAPEHFNLLRT